MRPRSFSDEDLLETARRIFLEQGPGVSTTKIAQALGVSQAALFKRFATKQKLMLRALLPRIRPSWIKNIEAGPDARPVPEQLLEIVNAIDKFFAKMMPAISVVRSAGITPEDMFECFEGDPPPVAAHKALTKFFATLHEQGRIQCQDPHVAATAFMGAMHGHHNMRHMLGDDAIDFGENYAERMVATFWFGMKPD